MISALQHALYCERQFALIHLEQLWEENVYTAEGQLLHQRVNIQHRQKRKQFVQEYSLYVHSKRYNIIGVCDLVEFTLSEDNLPVNIVPVEYKRGKRKPTNVDLVQLCAQVLCLEEHFGISIPVGQVYYLQEHRRVNIELTNPIRDQTISLINKCLAILQKTTTPKAEYLPKKCNRCSLINSCFAKQLDGASRSVQHFLENQIRIHLTKEDLS
jgi:CRISPR-associated exonuclease Cas4